MKKIYVAIAMTFEREKAIQKIENELDPVAQLIARIFVHAPSTWDEAMTQLLARSILTSGTPEKLARIITFATLTTRDKLRLLSA